MKKKLIMVFMAVVMVLSFAACSADETGQAKATVENFLGAIKKVDIDKANEYVSKNHKLDPEKEAENPEDAAMGKNLAEKMVKDLTYTYESGEVAKDATEAELTYKIKSKDVKQIVPKIIGIMFSSMDDEAKAKEEISKLSFDDIETVEGNKVIKLVKEEGKWKIADPNKTLEEVLGLGDLKMPF